MISNLYKRIDVWEKINSETAVRYVCFEIIQEQKYCVQSKDFFRFPVENKYLAEFEIQVIELFIETNPEKRSKSYNSLAQAIEMHNKEFNS